MRRRLRPSQACSSSASVTIARDFRAHRSERALPGETQNSIREMQLRAGDEMLVRVEANSNPVTECLTEPRTPGLGGIGGQGRCSHDCQLSAVDKLLCKCVPCWLR